MTTDALCDILCMHWYPFLCIAVCVEHFGWDANLVHCIYPGCCPGLSYINTHNQDPGDPQRDSSRSTTMLAAVMLECQLCCQHRGTAAQGAERQDGYCCVC